MASSISTFAGFEHGIFAIERQPSQIKARVLFLQGLFEQLNQNRHAFNQASISFASHGFATTLFDYYGTGDSQGELIACQLSDWQKNILSQLERLQALDNKPIVIVAFGSAALLLNNEIIEKVGKVYLWHPEVNAKRYFKQLERLTLLDSSPNLSQKEDENFEISGYLITHSFWQTLKAINYSPDDLQKEKLVWLECVDELTKPLGKAREKQCKAWLNEKNLYLIKQQKYWLSAELVVPELLIADSLKLLQAFIDEY